MCFGGCALKMGCILPFEFLRYLSSNYEDKCDLLFYIDLKKKFYNSGIEGIGNNIHEVAEYLKHIIQNYEKVIFMGVSAGGYAAILFGSLCNVTNVLAFIPITILNENYDYPNLRDVINQTTKYELFGDISIRNVNDLHHIRHCDNLKSFENVRIHKLQQVIMSELRDNGKIKEVLDNILLT